MSLGQKKILLVEDSRVDAELISLLFPGSGTKYQFHRVDDGNQALLFLRVSRQQKPDLIVLDLNLPIRDGREVLQEIKVDPQLKSIPVVVLTTSQSDTDRDRCLALGANGFFSKSPDLGDFERTLGEIERLWMELPQSLGPN